jgi:hypothetical protein
MSNRWSWFGRCEPTEVRGDAGVDGYNAPRIRSQKGNSDQIVMAVAASLLRRVMCFHGEQMGQLSDDVAQLRGRVAK